MLRDAPRSRFYLDPEPPGAKLAPLAPCCGCRHLPGQPCPVVRILPPGGSGGERSAIWTDSRLKAANAGLRRVQRTAEARGTREATKARQRAPRGPLQRFPSATLARGGQPPTRLRLCPDCRRWEAVPAHSGPRESSWRCWRCRLGRPRLRRDQVRARDR